MFPASTILTLSTKVCHIACLAAICIAASLTDTLYAANTAAEPQSNKGYRPLRVPPQWRFEAPTPAFSPQTGEKLGDFQAGIRVEVLDSDAQNDTWLVRYASYGAAPVDANIPWPNLSEAFAARWHLVQRELAEAELIDSVLASESPWKDTLPELALQYLKGGMKLDAGTPEAPERILLTSKDAGSLWGLPPVFVAVENGPDGVPIIAVEVWNKTDGRRVELNFPGRSVNNAYHLLREKLEILSRHLEGDRLNRPEDSDNRLSVVREQRTIYPLANRTQAVLRYQRNEYLILELRPFDPPRPAAALRSTQTTTADGRDGAQQMRLSERLRQNVTNHEDGARYVAGIPMINQGDKGYCVAATIARVMQYYGFQVDMHQMAYLADTEGSGTSYRDMVSAMRRVCNSTPYRFRTIRSRNRAELAEMSIERGMPLVWLVPGHVRLIIGFNPEKNEIVYSDSWGPGHEFKTMSWGEFINQTVELMLIDVGNN